MAHHEPYCTGCGKYLDQYEYEYIEFWCEGCYIKHREKLAHKLGETEEYYEAVEEDLDSFFEAIGNGGRTDCSVKSMLVGDFDTIYDSLSLLIPDELLPIEMASTADEGLSLLREYGAYHDDQ